MVIEHLIQWAVDAIQKQKERREAEAALQRTQGQESLRAQQLWAQKAAGIPEEPRKRKKKKRRHQDQERAAEAPPAARPAPPSVEEMLPTLPTVHEAEFAGRDMQRMFVLGEILGPPVALREDGPL